MRHLLTRLPPSLPCMVACAGGIISQLPNLRLGACIIIVAAYFCLDAIWPASRTLIASIIIACASLGAWRCIVQKHACHALERNCRTYQRMLRGTIASVTKTSGGDMNKVLVDLDDGAGTIEIFLAPNRATFTPGDTVSITNLKLIPLFDENALISMASKGIHGRARGATLQLETRQAPSAPVHFIRQCRSRLDQAIAQLKPETQAIFRAMICGEQDRGDEHLEQCRSSYNAWGIAHYLARSGIHVTLLCGALAAALMLIPLHLSIKQGALMLLMLWYAAITTSSISFIRALSMAILALFVALMRWPHNLLHIFSITTFALLMLNPLIITRLDFQLSFLLTALLLIRTQSTRILRMQTPLATQE